MSKKDVYIAKMNLQIAELNDNMHELESKAKEARDDAREKYKEEMTKLREQSALAGQKLETLKTTAEDGWDAMVEEMEKVRDAFTSSFHYFKSQIK
jgi:predicted  nucleic acid-binding Zn-ribbon protein